MNQTAIGHIDTLFQLSNIHGIWVHYWRDSAELLQRSANLSCKQLQTLTPE